MIKLGLLIVVLLFSSSALLGSSAHSTSDREPVIKGSRMPSVDHSKFPQLNQDFDYAPDVTLACLECHVSSAKEIHKSFHWNWGAKIKGKKVGKGENAMNNFCISARGNNGLCTSCHIGYGWKNDDFDFEEEENVDCLACHDTTGTYSKYPLSYGHPAYQEKKSGSKLWKAVDLRHIAQSVGKPDRDNCLMCHANGGGGNGVKHGDTDMSLVNPPFELDVHMSPDKLNFSCQQCHTTKNHRISGRYYDRSAFIDHKRDGKREGRKGHNVSCESCHGETPHDSDRINGHSAKVACATCHIPKYARGPYLTKLSWDWSTAGKKKNGKPYKIDQEFDGVVGHSYMSKKGTFVWGRNVIPSYRWYNGEMEQLTFQDKFNPKDAPIDINRPKGSIWDSKARIWPFKIHHGKQPYDTVNNNLLPPRLFGKKGSGAFWADFDWAKSLELGAKDSKLDYSGKYGFIETNGYWLIKHMVAPREESLKCLDCHIKKTGRLEELKEFYLLGRDQNVIIKWFGILFVIGSLIGCGLHALFNRESK